MKFVRTWTTRLQHFAGRPWYAWALGLLAGLDNWVFFIPTDGLLISSVLLAPKRWLQFIVLTTLGSSMGAATVILAISSWGLPWLQTQWPDLVSSSAWIWTEQLFATYGLWLLFGIAAVPLMLHPALALAVAAHHSNFAIIGVVLLGRVFKYSLMATLARWAPRALSFLWGIKDELKDVGVDKT